MGVHKSRRQRLKSEPEGLGEWLQQELKEDALLAMMDRQIGGEPRAQLRWLLLFAQRDDMDQLTQADCAALTAGLYVLTMRHIGSAKRSTLRAPLTSDDLRELADEIRSAAEALTINGVYEKETTTVRTLQRTNDPSAYRGRGLRIMYRAADLSDGIRLTLVDLLAAEGARLETCGHCRNFFIAAKQGLYCSPKCSQDTRTARHLTKIAKTKLAAAAGEGAPVGEVRPRTRSEYFSASKPNRAIEAADAQREAISEALHDRYDGATRKKRKLPPDSKVHAQRRPRRARNAGAGETE